MKRLLHVNGIRDLAALLVLAAAVILFFWPVVWGSAWIPRGGGDSVSFIYPMYRFAAQSFWSGTIPLWNPYQYAGSPFIMDNQSGIFYPVNLLLFLINPNFDYQAIEWLILWHFFFAGAAMFFCLRYLRPEDPTWRPAAVVGGLAYMFSGVFIAHIGNLNLIAVSAWLPLTFLALHRAIEAKGQKSRWYWALASGTFIGLSTLAGHGQMTFLLAAFLGTYAIYRSLTDRQIRPLLLLAAAGATGFVLSAINIIPSAAGLQHTVRAGFGDVEASSYALPWQGLLGLFAPDFFGRGEVQFWGDWARVEYGYAGVLTLFLAGLNMFTRRNRLVNFFLLAGAIFLLLALGPNTALYPFLLRILPWFPFQVPARFLLLVDFCLAALAALGMHTFYKRRKTGKAYYVAAATVVLGVLGLFFWQYRQNIGLVPHHQQQMITAVTGFALFALGSLLLILAAQRGWISRPIFGGLAILLLGFDLIFLGRLVEIEWNDPRPGFAAGSQALAQIKNDPGLHRIEIATGAWQPNLPQMEGLYSIDGVYNPLELSNYAAYIGSVGYRGSTLYNLLGTKYIIGGKKEPPGDTNFIIPIYDADPEVTIYLNTLALPRVAMVYKATLVENHEQAFEAIHAEDFDPLASVILESGQPLEQEAGQAAITIRRYDPNRAVFEVTTDKTGYFLLSDIYHPDWQATIDGQDTPIRVADYALRAVLVEPGTHLIDMQFRPQSWTWGASITLLGWLGVIILFSVGFWVHRQSRKSGHNLL